jgi:hypothetical protein
MWVLSIPGESHCSSGAQTDHQDARLWAQRGGTYFLMWYDVKFTYLFQSVTQAGHTHTQEVPFLENYLFSEDSLNESYSPMNLNATQMT